MSRYKLSGEEFAQRQQERVQRRTAARTRISSKPKQTRTPEDERWDRVWDALIERGVVLRDEEWIRGYRKGGA